MINISKRPAYMGGTLRNIRLHWRLLVFLIPVLLYFLIFNYGPMLGLIIAFEDYKPSTGLFGSAWVGFKHFSRLFGLKKFYSILGNTLTLSIYSLIAGFPLPIILALILNNCPNGRVAKLSQTITYAPHFISTVVIVGMINVFFSPSTGIVRTILVRMGLLEGYLNTLMRANAFPHLYVWSDIWKSMGWGSIVYLSALTAIDPSLHEAAVVDGASKIKRVLHIDLPSILPTIIIMFILRMGSIMSMGFEKAYIMQNSSNQSLSEIISTYVYKIGIKQGQFSFSTALDFFNSIVNLFLVVTFNFISRKMSEISLW